MLVATDTHASRRSQIYRLGCGFWVASWAPALSSPQSRLVSLPQRIRDSMTATRNLFGAWRLWPWVCRGGAESFRELERNTESQLPGGAVRCSMWCHAVIRVACPYPASPPPAAQSPGPYFMLVSAKDQLLFLRQLLRGECSRWSWRDPDLCWLGAELPFLRIHIQSREPCTLFLIGSGVRSAFSVADCHWLEL